MGTENKGFISLNDVADAVKAALGEGFVYRTSRPDSDSVTVRAAIRQSEEFSALFSPVLWDEFIPSGADTPGSKLSTLFNRKLGYINRHGLVSARKAYHKLINPELFAYQLKHVEGDLIHLSARRLAHGTEFFSESRISADENRSLDYTAARTAIISNLASSLTALIAEKEPFGRICLITSALRESGCLGASGVTEDGVVTTLSALLLLSLNLFGEDETEYGEITAGIGDIVRTSVRATADKAKGELSRSEVAELVFELSRLAGERFEKCDKISSDELERIFFSLI